MIDVKEAVARAQTHFAELSPRGGILFEEVELQQDSEGHFFWLVTLSAPSPGTSFNLSGGPSPRDYKIFRIDADNGSLESVKIRHL
jgi:hypothetical protein